VRLGPWSSLVRFAPGACEFVSSILTGPTNPTTHTTKRYEEQIVAIQQHDLWLRKQGYRPLTVRDAVNSLKALAKVCDLDDPEKVLEALAFRDCTDGQKEKLSIHYDRWVKHHSLSWSKPRYRRQRRIPNVPSESDVKALLDALPQRQSVFLQFLMETGARPNEAWNTKWFDIKPDSQTVIINHPLKGSNARIIRVSKNLITRIQCLRSKCSYVFKYNDDSDIRSFSRFFYRTRLSISKELGNPRITGISFKSMRHFRGTQLYSQTKDLLYVQSQLGHRSISSTMVYVHLINGFESDPDEWLVKVCENLEDYVKYLSEGYQYISDWNQLKIIRKKK